jgi:hypothetical protein
MIYFFKSRQKGGHLYVKQLNEFGDRQARLNCRAKRKPACGENSSSPVMRATRLHAKSTTV